MRLPLKSNTVEFVQPIVIFEQWAAKTSRDNVESAGFLLIIWQQLCDADRTHRAIRQFDATTQLFICHLLRCRSVPVMLNAECASYPAGDLNVDEIRGPTCRRSNRP